MRGWSDVPDELDAVRYAIAGRRCQFLWDGKWNDGTLAGSAFGADGRRIVSVRHESGGWFAGGTWAVSFPALPRAE